MKKLLLAVLMLVPTWVCGAITDLYVNNSGSGDGTGSSEANAMSWATFKDYMETGGSYTAAAGDRFNVIDDTYANTTTTITFVNGGSSTSPVIVRGYNTTITDGYQGRTNDNGALVTTNYPTISFSTGLWSVTGSYIIFDSLIVTGERAGVLWQFATGSNCIVKNCYVTNNNTNASTYCVRLGGVGATLLNSDVAMLAASGGAQAVLVDSGGARVLFSRITGNTAPGIVASQAARIQGCTIYDSTIGISLITTAGVVTEIIGNTIYSNSDDGISLYDAMTATVIIVNNMITDNGAYGIDCSDTDVAAVLAYNRFRDNFSGAINSGTDWVAATSWGHVTTDTGGVETDYVAAGSLDLRLISASPAKGAGVLPYTDIGSAQREESASSVEPAISYLK
jgi:hypothetical protein